MKKITFTLLVLALLIVAWWLLSPLVRDRSVDEALPDDLQAIINQSSSGMALVITQAEGSFTGTDDAHQASGRASVLKNSMDPATITDEDYLLRLSDFKVTNGPQLHVLLSPEANPLADGLGEYVDLGKLRGNIGDQNYPIPPSLNANIGEYQSVIIYCKPFRVIFAFAPLESFR